MSVVKLPDLVIASGATESSAIPQKYLDHLDELVIHAPASSSGTASIEVTDEDPDYHDSPTWRALVQPDGTAIPIADGESIPIPFVSFAGLRIVTTVAPGADETYTVTGQDRAA